MKEVRCFFRADLKEDAGMRLAEGGGKIVLHAANYCVKGNDRKETNNRDLD